MEFLFKSPASLTLKDSYQKRVLISKKGFRLASLSDLEIELSSSTVQKLNGIFSLCLCQNHAFNAKVRNDKPLKIIKIKQ